MKNRKPITFFILLNILRMITREIGASGMNSFSQILGFSLIIFSWILWGVILVLPFLKLNLTQYAIIYPVVLGATNIFWVGAALVGKDIIQKFKGLQKLIPGRKMKQDKKENKEMKK
jgi:hypothetical protein